MAGEAGCNGIHGDRSDGRRLRAADADRDGNGGGAGAFPRVPDGEPAHQPVSGGAQAAAGHLCQAAVQLRRQSGDGGHRHRTLPHRRVRRAGAVRRRGAGKEYAGAAAPEKDPRRAGAVRQRRAEAGAGVHHRGCAQCRQRVAGAEAGGADGGTAHREAVRQPEKAPRRQDGQPAENTILHRSGGGRSGGTRPPRHRAVRRDAASAGGRRGEGLYQDQLRRQRLPVCTGHVAGSGEQIHRRRRRGGGKDEAEQAVRRPVGQDHPPGQGGGKGSGRGADQAVRPAPAADRLRLFAGLPVAAGV